MRFVTKDLTTIPDSLTNTTSLESLALVLSGDLKKISSDFYRGTKIINDNGEEEAEVVYFLKKLYSNKCAYCESRTNDPEVEHYRPKKRVTRVRPTHGGYFWLCYTWSNLVPACHHCNRIGKGKGNKFPIINEAVRLRLPPLLADGSLDVNFTNAATSPLIDEQPYLLHPEIDDPKEFFRFTKTGRIKGTDNLERGKKTISICNLNRMDLVEERQSVIDEFLTHFKYAFLNYHFLLKEAKSDNKPNLIGTAQRQLVNNFKIIFQRLEERQSPNRTFTLIAWYIFENFETIFIPLFDSKLHRTVLKNAYQRYRNDLL